MRRLHPRAARGLGLSAILCVGAWGGALYGAPSEVEGAEDEIGVEAEEAEVIVVIGERPEAALKRSAAAVTVVSTEPDRRITGDLGEILARTEGVGVRRAGGLGSGARLSLNGLTGEQVRVLVDGVPLQLSGYGRALSNLPLDLVERVEIYRGVVPIELGADALGGALNVVTQTPAEGAGGAATLEIGSFGTQRVTAGAHHRWASGWFVRAQGYLDRAENDYPVEVDLVDAQGRQRRGSVRRFHDAYRAHGGGLEVGVVDQPWADQLSLRGFGSTSHKELQHNAVMSRPFGEPTVGQSAAGISARYALARGPAQVAAVAGAGRWRGDFVDEGEWLYDWRGERLLQRTRPGELDGQPHNRTTWDQGVYARAHASYAFTPEHQIAVALSPTLTDRTGTERRRIQATDRDPLDLDRRLGSLVTGLAYTATLWGGAVESVTFVKGYHQWAQSEEALPGQPLQRREASTHAGGVGEALRLTLGEGAQIKASYEYALRLPRPEEIFGDTVLVLANLELKPERSHNLNLGVAVDSRRTWAGRFQAELDGFARLTDDLILLWGSDQYLIYENVYAADAYGLTASARWAAPGRWGSVGGNLTWQDLRNTASDGVFGAFEGSRIPNRPWLFANGDARLHLRGWPGAYDALSLVWHTRYVGGFFRGWEGLGDVDSKQRVPGQLVHTAALVGEWVTAGYGLSLALEARNLSDARTYDFFGVQRPGRAWAIKLTAEVW